MARPFPPRSGADPEWDDRRRHCCPDPACGRGLDHPGADAHRQWGCYGHCPRARADIHPDSPACYGVADPFSYLFSYLFSYCLSYYLCHPFAFSGANSEGTGPRTDPMHASARLAPHHGRKG